MSLSREQAAALGHQTVRILEQGQYATATGARVDIAAAAARAAVATVSYPPGEDVAAPQPRFSSTRVEIVNESTLVAALRLVAEGERPVALNFASATRPGGGFLSGARAQEESLARSSGLFACLAGNPMYAFHMARRDSLYTAYVLYSPDVPVIRTDDGTLLDLPWSCSFLTSPAPYTRKVLAVDPARGPAIEAAFRSRIAKVLRVGAAHGHDTIVLGAWGCGAFGGDPHMVAELYAAALAGPFAGAYRRVVFPILDTSKDEGMIGTFRRYLGGQAS